MPAGMPRPRGVDQRQRGLGRRHRRLTIAELPGRIERRLLRRAVQRDVAAGRHRDEVRRHLICSNRAGGAAAEDRLDEAGPAAIGVAQRREEGAAGRPHAERPDHDIDGGQQPRDDAPRRRAIEVERQRALARVEQQVRQRPLDPLLLLAAGAGEEGGAGAQVIAGAVLDAHDAGAEFGQHARALGGGLVAQVQHGHVGQGQIGRGQVRRAPAGALQR